MGMWDERKGEMGLEREKWFGEKGRER